MLLEEAYEVVDAANARDIGGLAEELGDLLFLVMFYSCLAEEQGSFTIDDVANRVHDKLVRRHPHVFGETRARNPEEALQSWLSMKEKERGENGKPARESVLDGILLSLPSTLVAQEMGTRAAEAGFDWAKVDDLLDKIKEEVEELRQELATQSASSREDSGSKARVEEEVGDLLFAAANMARFLRSDPESCLRRATMKFKRRFQAMERRIQERGRQMKNSTLEELDAVWNEVKAAETHEN